MNLSRLLFWRKAAPAATVSTPTEQKPIAPASSAPATTGKTQAQLDTDYQAHKAEVDAIIAKVAPCYAALAVAKNSERCHELYERFTFKRERLPTFEYDELVIKEMKHPQQYISQVVDFIDYLCIQNVPNIPNTKFNIYTHLPQLLSASVNLSHIGAPNEIQDRIAHQIKSLNYTETEWKSAEYIHMADRHPTSGRLIPEVKLSELTECRGFSLILENLQHQGVCDALVAFYLRNPLKINIYTLSAFPFYINEKCSPAYQHQAVADLATFAGNVARNEVTYSPFYGVQSTRYLGLDQREHIIDAIKCGIDCANQKSNCTPESSPFQPVLSVISHYKNLMLAERAAATYEDSQNKIEAAQRTSSEALGELSECLDRHFESNLPLSLLPKGIQPIALNLLKQKHQQSLNDLDAQRPLPLP